MRERASKHNRLPVCKPAAPPVCPVTFPPQRQTPPATPQVSANPIPHLHPLQITPNPFVRVQLRRRARQPAVPAEAAAPHPATNTHIPPGCDEWNGRTPHPKSAAACPVSHPIPQLLHKPDDIGAPVSPLLYRPVQFPGHTDGADGAQMLPAQPAPDDRSLSHRRLGAPQRREQVKGRFVGP